MSSVDNKRVAKNAIALSVRTLISVCVGLYTSRLVLKALGVEDFGIYGVVGGIVGFSSFLNGSMAGATSRFITFELGKGNSQRLRQIFNTAFWAHLLLALFVIVLAETIGLWFLNYKMVIPADRIIAANIVYQISVFSVIVGFTQVPYSAMLIAHEKMSVYAYIEIINVTLKLFCTLLLFRISSDRLIIYALMVFCISTIIAVINRVYCIRRYSEARLSMGFDKTTARELAVFSGNDLYANMCVAAKDYGLPLLLNLFFGVIANAASTITATITGSVVALSSTVAQAFRPQIIKQYAVKDIPAMTQIMRRSVQFSLLTFSYIAIPFILMTSEILQLWLGDEPQYASMFIKLVMCSAYFNIINNASIASIHASGKIKLMSLMVGTLCLCCPLLSYIFLHTGASINTPYIINIVIFAIIILCNWVIVKRLIPDFCIRPYTFSIIKSLISIALAFVIMYFIRYYIINDVHIVSNMYFNEFLRLSIFTIIAVIISSLITYFIAFNQVEKKYLSVKLKRILMIKKAT